MIFHLKINDNFLGKYFSRRPLTLCIIKSINTYYETYINDGYLTICIDCLRILIKTSLCQKLNKDRTHIYIGEGEREREREKESKREQERAREKQLISSWNNN